MQQADFSGIQIEIVGDVERFEGLHQQWTALLNGLDQRTPFLTHEWLLCWWKHFGRGFQLFLIVVWEDGCIRAVAPLMKGRLRYLGMPLRVVQSLSNFHTGRIDFIVREPKTRYLTAIFQALAAEEWDMFVMYPILSAAPAIEVLRDLSTDKGYRFFSEASLSSPYVEIGGNWEYFLSTLKSKKRRFLQSKWNHILEVGTPRLESCFCGVGHPVLINTVMEISGKSWKANEGTAIASTVREQGFYRELTETAHKKGWLDLHVLRVANEAVAFEYNLTFDGKNYALKMGYDAKFSKYSPGTVLKRLVFDHLHERGVKEQDFLGEDDQFKRTYTSKIRQHCYVRILRPNWRTNLIWLMRIHLWPWLKKIQIIAGHLPILDSGQHHREKADGSRTDGRK